MSVKIPQATMTLKQVLYRLLHYVPRHAGCFRLDCSAGNLPINSCRQFVLIAVSTHTNFP
jgi:hypothetical protein